MSSATALSTPLRSSSEYRTKSYFALAKESSRIPDTLSYVPSFFTLYSGVHKNSSTRFRYPASINISRILSNTFGLIFLKWVACTSAFFMPYLYGYFSSYAFNTFSNVCLAAFLLSACHTKVSLRMGNTSTSPCSFSISISSCTSSGESAVSFASSASVISVSPCPLTCISITSAVDPDSFLVSSSITSSWNRRFTLGFGSNTTPPPMVSIGE